MPDDDTSPDPYRHNIGTILVKQREGPEKEEPTLPWIMKHLKPLKAAGPYRDWYEHYKLCRRALCMTSLRWHSVDGSQRVLGSSGNVESCMQATSSGGLWRATQLLGPLLSDRLCGGLSAASHVHS